MEQMTKPEMTVVKFDEADVITTSGDEVKPDCTIQECTTECTCNGPFEM